MDNRWTFGGYWNTVFALYHYVVDRLAEESSPELPSGSKKDYAQGILDAIKDEDADALAEALEGFQLCCSEEEDE